jgi:hypothetical protein
MTRSVNARDAPAERNDSFATGAISPSARHSTSSVRHAWARRSTSGRISRNGRGDLIEACTRLEPGELKCTGRHSTRQSSVRTTSMPDGSQASSSPCDAASTSAVVQRSIVRT